MSAATENSLIENAWKARDNAYAPYSMFKVGAALLCEDETVFTGCNVENISFGLTNCAERVAIGTAIAAGNQKFTGVAIVADTGTPISPCGACRQVMAEFGIEWIILANRESSEKFTLAELLPRASAGILDRD